MITKKIKVAYIHGRPAAHPLHERFAKSLNAIPFYVDNKLRWQDKDKNFAYKILSWTINAVSFKDKSYFDVFLVDGIHMPPVLMKALHLIKKDQKIIAHLGSHTLYFLYAHKFSKPVEWLHLQMLKRYDAVFCEGQMAATFVKKLVGENGPKIYTTFLGPPKERFNVLMNIAPQLESNNILFISHGPGEFRKYYKGLDLMIDAFALAKQTIPDLHFDIVGDWDEEIKRSCLVKHNPDIQKAVRFVGRTDKIEEYLSKASLYLHCSRGDAFPTSTMEAMAAGLIPLVSEWTGTKEVVSQIDNRFIASLDIKDIADKIIWYMNMPLEEKKQLSVRCRELAKEYTEENATLHYQKTFGTMLQDFNIN